MSVAVQHGSDHEFLDLLRRAREGDREALGALIDRLRPYLMKVAHHETDSSLKQKVGDSDLVQSACVDALKAFERFRGTTSIELLRWLRQILLYKLGDVRDRYHADKRDIHAEIPLQFDPEDSGAGGPAASIPSPSEQAVRNEEIARFEAALLTLPRLDQTIFEMRQKEGHAFAEIARQLHLTEEGARKRWWRAIQALQEKVRAADDSSAS